MATTKILLDTGPLVAYLNKNDQYHSWAVRSWSTVVEPVVTCDAVLSEAIFLLKSEDIDPEPVFQLVERGIVQPDFVLKDHRSDVFRLLRKYADRPMSLADACLVRMSELSDSSQVMTTDSDFQIYRRKGRHVIPLLIPR